MSTSSWVSLCKCLFKFFKFLNGSDSLFAAFVFNSLYIVSVEVVEDNSILLISSIINCFCASILSSRIVSSKGVSTSPDVLLNPSNINIDCFCSKVKNLLVNRIILSRPEPCAFDLESYLK